MAGTAEILYIGTGAVRERDVSNLCSELGFHARSCRLTEALDQPDLLEHVDAVILEAREMAQSALESSERLMKLLDRLAAPSLILDEADGSGGQKQWQRYLHIGPDESPEMIKGRLATLVALRPLLNKLHRQRQMADRMRQPLHHYMNEVDEEMRLAARLQQDFLPRQLPQIEGFRFASIYRPATWVSGDIYDLTRLDESHIGFYVADAVGHGMPAALLTMFIKRAIQPKRIDGHDYELLDPAEVLTKLNADLIEQDLSNFQFITGCYGILNTRTLELKIANGGHPAPLLIDADESRELEVSGPLLGVFPEPHFTTETFQLKPGQKLLLFSDGVEVAFVNEGPDKPLRFREEFGNLSGCDVQTMCSKLMTIINAEEGSLHPRDDVTILGIEII